MSVFRNAALKKCLLILVWGITLFGIGFGISFYKGVGKKYDAVVEVPVEEISLAGIEDGSYTGEYTFETMYAKVQVVIKGEEIKKIVLEEFETEKGEKAADIVDGIVENQSVMVDDISGATDSSRVIKLAVINAINGQ